jgi:DNA-binding MarR family transcriptional regulator
MLSKIEELILFTIKTEAGASVNEIADLLGYSRDYIQRKIKKLHSLNFIRLNFLLEFEINQTCETTSLEPVPEHV